MSDQIIHWLAAGERGISSDTIVQTLTGIPALGGWRASHPHDPADLRRCVLLLESCPELAARFDEMRRVSPEWERLFDAWPELVATMDAEAPGWREPKARGRAPRTYDRMQRIIHGAEA